MVMSQKRSALFLSFNFNSDKITYRVVWLFLRVNT